jgi:patatin-like phospholipase/acyl hydrolase
MASDASKKPSVFILYIPGGGMMGIIPAMVLTKIESLTETPTRELFQVMEGVSTGSIIVAGLSQPDMSAKKGMQLFVEQGPRFFPDLPGRLRKMSLRNGLNLGKYFFNLDSSKTDFLKIREIHQICDRYKSRDITPEIATMIEDLREIATDTWLKSGAQKKILAMCETIATKDPENRRYCDAIAEIAAMRTYNNALSAVFKRSAAGFLDTIKDYFAAKDEYLFDPDLPKEYYQETFGETRISDSPNSLYISSYDVVRNRAVTYSKFFQDPLHNNPEKGVIVQNDLTKWDAVMSSTANPFAYPPHLTESNLLTTDKAIVHKPRSVKDVLGHVSKDTRVVLFIAGTSKNLSEDLIDFIARDLSGENEMSETEQNRKKLKALSDYYTEFGVFGNMVLGREISELEGYTSSAAVDEFEDLLGKENVIQITPRTAPYTPKEEEEFPSGDPLDASRDNIKKIIRRGRKLIEDEDDQIRKVSQMLVDNLHVMNKIDNEKYTRLCRKIGLKMPDTELERDTRQIEENIPSNDQSTGLRRIWRAVSRSIFPASKTPNSHRNTMDTPPGPSDGPQ